MLLQSGHHMGADQLYHQSDTTNGTAVAINKMEQMPSQQQQHQQQQQQQQQSHQQPANTAPQPDQQRYLELMQSTLKDEWSVHAAKDGRLYYCK